MYTKTQLSVKTLGKLTTPFPSKIGVRQGDNLSPTLFNIFINDLPKYINREHETFPVTLGTTTLNCLLYADDLVLISTTKEGLQKCIDATHKFTEDWHLSINLEKSKALIFNKQGNLIKEKLMLGNQTIQCTDSYTYLGLEFTSSGNFAKSIETLHNKSLKALYKLNKMTTGNLNIKTILHIFDNTIKPILLYGAEVWAPYLLSLRDINNSSWINKLDKHKTSQLEMKFYKQILKVKRNTSTIGIRGELGRHPLLLNAFTNSIKYFHSFNTKPTNKLVNNALLEAKNTRTTKSWYNLVTTLESQISTTHIRAQRKQEIKRHSKNILHKMKIKYEEFWHSELFKDTSNLKNKGGNKLRSYRFLKQQFHLEPYLYNVDNVNHRTAITRLRLSSHYLNIETLRGSVSDPNLRLCSLCTLNEKEDEEHFMLRCEAFTQHRQELLMQIQNSNNNTSAYSHSNWFIFLLTSESKQICKAVGKYISECMQIRKNGKLQPSTVCASVGTTL